MNFKAMSDEPSSFNRVAADKSHHSALALSQVYTLRFCLTDSFVFTLGHCVDFKAMYDESTSFNRIAGDKSHHVAIASV